jgi:hypothetical protein
MLRSYAVEQIIRERNFPVLETYRPRLKLSPLLLITFIMLLGFTLLTMSVQALAQSSLHPPNPFTSYTDVFPGQPAAAVVIRGFSCEDYYNDYRDPEQAHCTISLSRGAFSTVQLIVSVGIIRQITFTLRDNTLQMGDLQLLLDMPAIRTRYQGAHFSLPDAYVRAKTTGFVRRFSLFLPVQNISFIEIVPLT